MKFLFLAFTYCALLAFNDKLGGPNNSSEPIVSKERAFAILDNKCNSCHRIKNKRRIFTIENMDGYVKKIHKQVFVWKRMPKKSAPQLTTTEYGQLKSWITTQILK